MSRQLQLEDTNITNQDSTRTESPLSLELSYLGEEQLTNQKPITSRAGSMSSVWSTEQSNPFLEGSSKGKGRENRARSRRLTEAHEDTGILAPMHESLSKKSPIQFGNIHPGDEQIESIDPLSFSPPRTKNVQGKGVKKESTGISIPPMTQEELRLESKPTILSSFKAQAPRAEEEEEEEYNSPLKSVPNFAASFNFKPKDKETIPSSQNTGPITKRLVPLGKPRSITTTNGERVPVKTIQLRLPTTSMPLTTQGHEHLSLKEIQERYFAIIEHAQQTLGRYIPLEQNQRRKELMDEPLDAVSKKLNRLLFEVEQYTTEDGEDLYRVNERRWRSFLKGLADAKELCLSIFERARIAEPKVPQWGPNGETTLFWTKNDFEILSVVARCDVEDFMLKIRDIVHWDHMERNRAKENLESGDQGRESVESNEGNLATLSSTELKDVEIMKDALTSPLKKKESTRKEEGGFEGKDQWSNSRPSIKREQSAPFNPNPPAPLANRKVLFLQPRGFEQQESSSRTFHSMFTPSHAKEEMISDPKSSDIKQEERTTSIPTPQVKFVDSPGGSDDSSSSSSSDSDRGNKGRGSRRSRRKERSKRKSKGRRVDEDQNDDGHEKEEPRFDHRLKSEVIPTCSDDHG